MPSIPRRALHATAIVATLLLTPVLTACGTPLEGIVSESVESAVEDATGTKVESGGEIPADFPAEVPLIDGEVTYGGSLEVNGTQNWTVTITTTEPVADAFANIRTQLTDAGFMQSVINETADSANGAFTGTNYSLIVTASVADSQTSITYVVTSAVAG
ncbi:hypothetical protein [Homoserinimonas hongtaonis]|uniref:hypothetical protein n=1 Tax=Homoserinimonas hongtaonis TaxID=2079791 RepID=UPI000D3AB38C|nr:hypothetical protein [Salinibacterium hongtaonis]AWB90074.1 hypothetical protein C2138_11425 [Salinibacterium hongtaonis]